MASRKQAVNGPRADHNRQDADTFSWLSNVESRPRFSDQFPLRHPKHSVPAPKVNLFDADKSLDSPNWAVPPLIHFAVREHRLHRTATQGYMKGSWI
jgi:hypothetical protein